MDERYRERASKLLSLVLRHRPDEFGVTVDGGGWTDIDALLDALRQELRLSRADLETVAAGGETRRFEISADGRRVRATHGHSIPGVTAGEPATPPAVLFHGTASRSLDAIRADGLRAGDRLLVHLSETRADAQRIGDRRANPVILEIDAAGMAAAGVVFRRSTSGVWLVPAVPAARIRFPAA